jgi:hypothetical protein
VRLKTTLLTLLGSLIGAAAGIWGLTRVSSVEPPAPLEELPLTISGLEAHAARGTGVESARVDSQITLRIPADQATRVYEYLHDTYHGKSGLLRDAFPNLDINGQGVADVSRFTDRYFDTPEFDLYRTHNSARHRSRINTLNANDRKSGRQLVQMKVTPPGRFDLRTELKYDVDQFPARQEEHPLLRLVKGADRPDCIAAFQRIGIDARRLQHVFTIEQTRSRIYINLGAVNIMSFSVDVGGATVAGQTATFASVDVGLVEIAYTEADDARRKLMWQVRDAAVADLLRHFPDLSVNSESKYSIVLAQLLRQPLPRLFLEHRESALTLACLAGLAALVPLIGLVDRLWRPRRRLSSSG